MRFLAAAPLLGFATIALLALSCSGDKAVYLKFTASVEDPRVAPGSAPQRLYKPCAESAAPDSVLPPAANSLWIAFYASLCMLGGCVGIGIGMGITMSITMGFFRANPICQADLGHWRRVHPIIPEVIF